MVTGVAAADINKLAEVLPKEETGHSVDADFLQFIVITNQSGCDIYDEYQTSMDGLNNVSGHPHLQPPSHLASPLMPHTWPDLP